MSDINLTYLLSPFIVVLVVSSFVVRWRLKKEPNQLRRATRMLKFNLMAVGIVLFVLWFALGLGTIIGNPDDLNDLQSMSDVLRYLQEYNQAIVRTAAVVSWTLFILIWWFLTALWDFSKVVGKIASLSASEGESPHVL